MKIVIGTHVDDLPITGPFEKEINKIKGLLKKRFDMKDLERARKILGIRITWRVDEIMIDQSQYANTIVRDFSTSGSKIYSTPMASNAVGELEHSAGKECTEKELKGYWKLL